MGILDAEQPDNSASVVLGRHGGNTPVMGACAGARGTAVATVQGDGVSACTLGASVVAYS